MNKSAQPVVSILDDDQEVRDGLAAVVQSAGHVVVSYSRPSQFLEKLDQATPGALILDVRLPEMSGLELQRHLNRIGSILPVILITNHADIPMVVEAMREGAFDFLEKPVKPPDLLERLNAALKKDANNRESIRRHADIRARFLTLSAREKEVLQLVVEGRANKVIALDLGLSERTVEVHRGNIMDKMSAQSLAHLVRMHMIIQSSVGSG
ncbi:response regulator transcription factor [Steroidobacter sp. S1-65]|uniref:Response regulator transcription factor n=1 Tax=Steroidobacter gossypii TaxID=2805490 RepID=A0ABS1X4M3_9GAMM|nr:response regulator [Steroidobacter gossypii]MBM0108164.1 response regulator transcription factor [Steroidobacter gossypii]